MGASAALNRDLASLPRAPMPDRRTLNDISDDLLALDSLLDEAQGDISAPGVEAAIDAWFAELLNDRDRKLNGYAWLINELEARANHRKSESQRLAGRARIDQMKAAHLLAKLKAVFEFHRWVTIETDDHRITLAGHGGVQPLELLVAPDDLPDRFITVEMSTKANTQAIREAIASGEDLSAFARLLPRGKSIRLR